MYSPKPSLSDRLYEATHNTWGHCLPRGMGGLVTNDGRTVTVVQDLKFGARSYPITIHSITAADSTPGGTSRYKETKLEIYHNGGVTTLTPASNPILPITLNGVSRTVITNRFDTSNTYGLYRRDTILKVSSTANALNCTSTPANWETYFMAGFYPEAYVGFFPSNTSVTAVDGKWSATVRLEVSVGYNGKLTFTGVKNAENVMINGKYISNGLQARAPFIFYAGPSDNEVGVTDLLFSGHVSEPGSHEIVINVQYTLP